MSIGCILMLCSYVCDLLPVKLYDEDSKSEIYSNESKTVPFSSRPPKISNPEYFFVLTLHIEKLYLLCLSIDVMTSHCLVSKFKTSI